MSTTPGLYIGNTPFCSGNLKHPRSASKAIMTIFEFTESSALCAIVCPCLCCHSPPWMAGIASQIGSARAAFAQTQNTNIWTPNWPGTVSNTVSLSIKVPIFYSHQRRLC